MRLFGFVVLENHLHAVARVPGLPAIWAYFKSFTALRVIEILEAHRAHDLLERMVAALQPKRRDPSHQFGQEGSHPQAIAQARGLVSGTKCKS